MTVHTIASKFRRALRNETGATFTNDQLRQLASHGVLSLLAQIEAEELCHAKPAHTLSETTGSTSAARFHPHPDILAEIERLTP